MLGSKQSSGGCDEIRAQYSEKGLISLPLCLYPTYEKISRVIKGNVRWKIFKLQTIIWSEEVVAQM